MPPSVTKLLADFDAFPKVETAVAIRTWRGGFLTLISYSLIVALVVAETSLFLATDTFCEFAINSDFDHSMMLDFDISVAIQCRKLCVALVDASGATKILGSELESSEINSRDVVAKTADESMHSPSRAIGSGDDTALKDSSSTGCRIRTSAPIPIGMVKGKLILMPILNVALGQLGSQLTALDDSINFSHAIHRFSLSDPFFSSSSNPLDSSAQANLQCHERYSYFLNVVPLIKAKYDDEKATIVQQYTAKGQKAAFAHCTDPLPGIYFNYDLEPLAMFEHIVPKSLIGLLGRLLGVCGGIYIISGVIYRRFLSVGSMKAGIS